MCKKAQGFVVGFTPTSSSLNFRSRQARHRQPSASPALGTGIGPCGNSMHQQFPAGLHSIGTLHFEHRVSME
jgi:hypothetical protein